MAPIIITPETLSQNCSGGCGDTLTPEEIAYPIGRKDSSEVLCDECYRDIYQEVCSWCEEYYDTPDTWEYVAVFDHEDVDLNLSGLYRILDTNFYAQPLIGSGWLSSGAITWVGYLPDSLEDEDGYPCGYFCQGCEQRALTFIYYRRCCEVAALAGGGVSC